MAILFACKSGFEHDLYDELVAFGSDPADLKFKKKQGYIFHKGDSDAFHAMRVVDFVFVRQMSFAVQQVNKLPESDRVTPLCDAILNCYQQRSSDLVYRDLHVGCVADDDQRGMGKFCQRVKQILENKLRKAGFKRVYSRTPVPNVHIVFQSYERAWVGLGLPKQSSPWEEGVPRLRMPADAPSRSTLKLEEAFLELITERERDAILVEGMSAVDLGASPGGWSYQLVKHGLTVTAVDNGPMDKAVMSTGMVDHLTVDAFKFEPRRPVDWLVCDVVEQPQRIAKLIQKWFQREWCARAIVNFKLPMHRRWDAVAELLHLYSGYELCRIRQLYHDRAEVTAFISK